MSSQVISFFSKRKRSTDWSQDEIAELYRIEHALVQARLPIDTDRGVTDEGEPWFVFCRRDGEVLVHITRSNGGYLLFGAGLAQPLSGPAIGELSRAFVSRVPQNLPPQQGEGATLLVHPAAVLAVLIGTIFATHGTYYGSGDREEDLAAQGEDAAVSKGSLQKIFAQVTDGVLATVDPGDPGWVASRQGNEEGHKEDSYLNGVCTLAAVLMGAAMGLQSSANELPLPLLPTETADGGDAKADAARPPDAELVLQLDDAGDTSASQSEAHTSNVASSDDDAASPVEPVPTHMTTVDKSDGANGNQSLIDAAPAHSTEAQPPIELPRFVAVESRIGESPKPAAESSGPITHTAGPSPAIHDDTLASNGHVVPSTPKATTAETTATMSAAAEAILHSIPAAKPSVGAQESSAQSTPQTGTISGDAPSPARADNVHLYPMFDNHARETLTEFLHANPTAQAIFYDSNVIVYDGDKDFSSRPVTVQVWEFDTGATIAIVGHADNPAHG